MKRNEIYWVTLDPVAGSEQSKRRPCVIVSPNELNGILNTYTIVPITSQIREFPYRVKCKVDGREGELICEQIRTVSAERFGPKINELSKKRSERTS